MEESNYADLEDKHGYATRRISMELRDGAWKIYSFMSWKKCLVSSTHVLTFGDTIIKLLKIWSDLFQSKGIVNPVYKLEGCSKIYGISRNISNSFVSYFIAKLLSIGQEYAIDRENRLHDDDNDDN